MKSFLLSLSLFSLHTAAAYGCQVSEAQVLGTVVEASASSATSCAVKVRLDDVAHHVFCPLNVGEGQEITLSLETSDAACGGLAGSSISGVLQNSGSGYRLDQ